MRLNLTEFGSILFLQICLAIYSDCSAIIADYPFVTIFEYTNQSDIIAIGKIIETDQSNRGLTKNCVSTMEVDRYLKGTGKKELSYYIQCSPLSPTPLFPGDCSIYKHKQYLVFLSSDGDKLFERISFTTDSSGRLNSIIQMVEHYVRIQGVSDSNNRSRAYCSLLIDFLKMSEMREEALHCLWLGTEDRSHVSNRFTIPYKRLFDKQQKAEMVKIGLKADVSNEFELNLLFVAFEFDKTRIEKKLFSILLQEYECTKIGAEENVAADFKYEFVARKYIDSKIGSYLHEKHPGCMDKKLINDFKTSIDCDRLNENKKKIVRVLSKCNH